jgi:hypothetical protein
MWRHFKSQSSLLILLSIWVNSGSPELLFAQGTAPATQPANSPSVQNLNPAPPPSKPPQRSASDLEKLVAPIALYPDPLIATVLPASAYPLEIVQAARFVKDTNNLAKLDEQPWDSNVRAVARIPQVIVQMDNNIAWTSDLGDAFINQPKAVMDAIQTMREKAQASGALKTTPQQVVTTEQLIVTNFVQQEPIYVTNEVVQIEPAEPNVIYVPQYNPTVVYAGYPVYPGYVYPAPYYGYPYYPGALAATAITFGAGMAMGAWIANGCDWGHGGCWHGSYHSDVNINRDVNRNIDRNRNGNRNTVNPLGGGGNRQKWQPDQNRLRNSGSTLSSAQSRDARGWGSGSRQTGTVRQTGSARTGARTGTSAQNRRASSPNTGRQLSPTSTRQGSSAANRPSTSTANRRPSQGANRPSTSQRGAFNTSRSAPQTRQSSSRGNTSRGISRGGSGGGGGGRSFGGGRGGGGGGRRR